LYALNFPHTNELQKKIKLCSGGFCKVKYNNSKKGSKNGQALHMNLESFCAE